MKLIGPSVGRRTKKREKEARGESTRKEGRKRKRRRGEAKLKRKGKKKRKKSEAGKTTRRGEGAKDEDGEERIEVDFAIMNSTLNG